MRNEAGQFVDLFIPRKCSASKKIIHSKEHGSAQINVVEVDENGVATSNYVTFSISENIRKAGSSDVRLMELLEEAKIIAPRAQ